MGISVGTPLVVLLFPSSGNIIECSVLARPFGRKAPLEQDRSSKKV